MFLVKVNCFLKFDTAHRAFKWFDLAELILCGVGFASALDQLHSLAIVRN